MMLKARSLRGNTLTEYGFIAFLILVASVVTVTLLGGNINNAMVGLRKDLNKNAKSTNVANSQVVDTGSVGGSPNILQLGQSTYDLSALNPQNLGEQITTSGANGTTQNLSNALLALARQLLDSGEITPEQAQSLIDLANQGHRIAQIEALIEGAAAGDYSGDMVFYQNFGTMSVSGDIGGTTWNTSVNALAAGLATNSANQSHYSDAESVVVGGDVARLNELLAAAQQSGALNNPAIQQAVTGLVSNINTIADGVASHVVAANVGSPPTNPNDIASAVASTVTNTDSATICGTGGDSDTGTSCQ